MTVENMIKNKYYKDVTGMWKIYDENEKIWRTQKLEPKEEIRLLKEDLVKTFKKEFLDKDFD
jgi:hypothetical protein